MDELRSILFPDGLPDSGRVSVLTVAFQSLMNDTVQEGTAVVAECRAAVRVNHEFVRTGRLQVKETLIDFKINFFSSFQKSLLSFIAEALVTMYY